MKKLLDVTEVMGKIKLEKEINILPNKRNDMRYEIQISKVIQQGRKISKDDKSIYLRLDEMEILATNLLKVVEEFRDK